MIDFPPFLKGETVVIQEVKELIHNVLWWFHGKNILDKIQVMRERPSLLQLMCRFESSLFLKALLTKQKENNLKSMACMYAFPL